MPHSPVVVPVQPLAVKFSPLIESTVLHRTQSSKKVKHHQVPFLKLVLEAILLREKAR